MMMLLNTLAKNKGHDQETERLSEAIAQSVIPNIENYQIKSIIYDDVNDAISFQMDHTINERWFSILKSGEYSHSSVRGYETQDLILLDEFSFGMPYTLNGIEGTIERIARDVQNWVKSSNEVYQRVCRNQYEQEIRKRETELKDMIFKREASDRANAMLKKVMDEVSSSI